MSHTLRQLNDTNLEQEILQSKEPLLVDFWADWCAPCKAIAPSLEELGGSYAGRATISKLDVDANAGSALRYGVKAIPTLILFKEGRERERLVGAQPKQAITDLLDRYAA